MKKGTNNQRVSINRQIRASEVRVIDDKEGNLGVMSVNDAVKKAEAKGLDLIEISPDANPPVARIADYGKYQYEQKKKQKEIKANQHLTETKSIQVKVGTGEGDLAQKAKRASDWLSEGHRVKVELFLRGRVKHLGKEFHRERLDRMLKLITTPHKVIDEYKQSPKGIMTTLEPIKQP